MKPRIIDGIDIDKLRAAFEQQAQESEQRHGMEYGDDAQLALSVRTFETCKYDPNNPLPVKLNKVRDEARVRRFRASDDTLDHYQEVIVPDGWKFSFFRKNAPMMGFHDYHTWPLGKCVAVGVVNGALYVDGEFDPPEIDESADMVMRKIDYGTVKAGSVGFIPRRVISASTAQTKAEKELILKYPDARRIHIEQELLEWTICPIGANPNALQAQLKQLAVRKYGLDVLPAAEPRTPEPDYSAAIERATRLLDRLKGE